MLVVGLARSPGHFGLHAAEVRLDVDDSVALGSGFLRLVGDLAVLAHDERGQVRVSIPVEIESDEPAERVLGRDTAFESLLF